MNQEEITQYLEASYIAVMGTISKSGVPHLTPNWYRYNGEVLTFVTTNERLKFANLQRDNRISICIYDPPRASQYVVLYGTATIQDATTGGQDVWDEIRRVIERYVEPPAVDDYVARWRTEPRVLVTVKPDHIATRAPRRR